MRITLDTNIMVASTFWAGAPDRIMRLVEDEKVDLVLSEDIIGELLGVLEYEELKKKAKDKGLVMRRSVEKIVSVSEVINPQRRLFVIKEDPDDDKFIECAVEGDAEYLISRDKHLLKLKKYKKIRIVKPEEFLKSFKLI